DVERIAEAYKARALKAARDVKAARKHSRLLGDNADRMAAKARETDDDVLRVILMDLEKVAVVHNSLEYIEHVVGLFRVVGHDAVKSVVFAVNVVVGLDERRWLEVVLRQEAQQLLDADNAVGLGF